MPDTNADLKGALRRHFRQARRDFVTSLTSADRNALESSLAALVQPYIAAARTPASYAAEKSEIDARLLQNGPTLHAYPLIKGKGLSFHRCARADLVAGHGGIFEPAESAPLVTPDVLLIPLLAATPDGRRLGQGGGFYDRALRHLRARGGIIAIGIAWDVQITDDLPIDAWDERLDHVATPSRLVDCAQFR